MHSLRRCSKKIYFSTNSCNILNILGYRLIRSHTITIPLRKQNFYCEVSDKMLTQDEYQVRSDKLLSKNFSHSRFYRVLQDFISICILFEDVALEYIFQQNLKRPYTINFLVSILSDLTR